jgi:exodeoxyribonuclease VII large subunit
VRSHAHLDDRRRHVDRAAAMVATAAGHHVRRAGQRADDREARLVDYSARPLTSAENRLTHIAALVRAVHPARTLALGYSITRDTTGRAVRSASDVGIGDTVQTELASGKVRSTVTDTDTDTTRTETS